MCVETFKNFASHIWSDESTKRYYLYLQEQYAITVTVVLYAKWCGMRGYHFPIYCIPFAKEFEKTHILPLRRERKTLKGKKGYKEILSRELTWEMRMIDGMFENFPPKKNYKDKHAK